MSTRGLSCFLAFHCLVVASSAFCPVAKPRSRIDSQLCMSQSNERSYSSIRRSLVVGGLGIAFLSTQPAIAEDADFYSPKFVQEYPDFIQTKNGWSYRDVKEGKGDVTAKPGDRVVFDWSGYTIGYFARPFQAKGGPFEENLDYLRTVIGSGQMIGALEQAMVDLKPGAVRQVLVPYGSLSYPADDPNHEKVGPKPASFGGMRALNFVLDNPRVDRTLLFNVKVIRVDKPNGKGGFVRG